MKLPLRPTLILGSAAGLALLAAACGSSGKAAGGPSSGGTASGAAITLNIEASPTGPIAISFNPFSQTSPALLLGARGMVYEPLIQYNLANPGQTYPWLATGYTLSNGDKTMTVTLRHGVTWSDGQPFTSADVAYTFSLIKQNPTINLLGDTPIVPEHVWSKAGNPVAAANAHPVGTGAYLVQSITPQGMTLVRNPHYWQPGLPKIGKLNFVVFDSNTSANLSLANGELDWAGNFVPHIQQLYTSRDPSHRFYGFPPLRTAYLVLNLTQYPFGDVRVRKALSMSLDRAAVVNAGEYGEQPPALSPTGLVLPLQNAQLSPKYAGAGYGAPDLNAARALLTQAGFRYTGGKLYLPDGKPFAFTILGPSAYTDVMADFQVIAQQWRDLGATVTLSGEAVNSWIQQLLTGQFQVTVGGPQSSQVVVPWAAYFNLLDSALASPIGKISIGDQEHFVSPQADALLAQWAGATTDAARLQAEYGIEDIMVNQVPAIPLFYNVAFAEWTSSKVTGWPTSADNYEIPAPFDFTGEVVALHLTPAR